MGEVVKSEVVWGVVLDDYGSMDYYDTEAEAVEDARRYRTRYARVTTDYFEGDS